MSPLPLDQKTCAGLPSRSFASGCALLLLTATFTAEAQTEWRSANGAWNVGNNWAGGIVPGAGAFALIANGGTSTVGAGVSGEVRTLLVGRENGGTVLINGGDLKTTYATIGQRFSSGPALGIGTVTVSNGGTWDVAGPSGNLSFPASIDIGNYGAAGFLNILEGGTVLANQVKVGASLEGTGTLSISGGTLSVLETPTSTIWIGYENPGIYTQSGGIATVRQMTLGGSSDATGSVTVSGGALDALLLIIGDRGTGVFTQTGGVVRVFESLAFGLQDGTGTLELTGGTFEVGKVEEKGEGTGRIKLNGGTLRALGNQLDFFQGFELGDITVDAGGAFIDTNGYSVGINYSLTGAGRLTKQGEGVLKLTAANYHTGGTTVKNGTLEISGSAASLLNATDLRIGDGFSDDAALSVNGGSLVSNSTTVGFAGGSRGLVTMDGGAWTEASILTVGYSGEGAVELIDGTIGVNGDIVLSEEATGSGRIAMDGGTFRSFANFTVGGFGAGYLELNGGEMILQSPTGVMSIASGAGSTGEVTIDGGSLSGVATLLVGVAGIGSLTLEEGDLSTGAAALGVGSSGRGAVTVNGGAWDLNGDLAVGAQGQGVLTINGGRVSQTGTTTLAAAFTTGRIFLTNASGAAGIFETSRIVEGIGSGSISFDGGILRALGNESAFVSGFEDGDLTILEGGATIDSGMYAIAITSGFSGVGGLTKAGEGTLTLSGTSSYTGATSVQEGQLVFNGVGSGAGSVSVKSGATLSGSGSFAGTVTIENAGILAPGSGAGTFTVGSLILNQTSELQFQLGTLSDLVSVAQALTLDGRLTVTAQSGFGHGTYTLFEYGGDLVNHGLDITSVPAGYYYSLDFTQAGSVRLLVDDAQYWDGLHTLPDGTVNGGSGSWNNATTNWTVFDGSSNQEWSGMAVAVFSGTAGVVDVVDTVEVRLIDFATDGYTLTGTGTLAGNGTTLTLNTGAGVEATIHTSISGSATVVKGGDGGRVTLMGSNSYLGGTTVKQGTMAVGAGGEIDHSAGDLRVGDTSGDDAVFEIVGGSVTDNNAIIGNYSGSRGAVVVTDGTWTNAGYLQVGYFGNGSLTISGGYVSNTRSVISYAGGSTGEVIVTGGTWANSERLLIGGGAGSLFIDGGAVTSSYARIGVGMDGSGTATVTSGTWTMDGVLSVGALLNASGGLLINGGTVSSGTGLIGESAEATGVATVSSGMWTTAGDITVGEAGTGTLNLTGGTVSANGGEGVLHLGRDATATGTLNIGTGGSTGTLQVASVIGGDGAATVNFDHTGSLTFASQLLGNLSVNKRAAGTTILTGSNTYTGPTTIHAGKLVVNGDHSGTGAVTVASGGTLAGTGTIAGAVTVQSGGTLAPGEGSGTLSITNTVSFASGSLLMFEGDGAFFNRLDVTGSVSIASGAYISFELLSPLTLASYTLLTAASGLDGTIPFTLMGAVPVGYELVYSDTELWLVSTVEIGGITITPDASTIITGGSTNVTVTVENSGSPGSPDLHATVTGTDGIAGSGNTTVAAGETGTVDSGLTFSSTTIGVQTGTVTVSDPLANNNPQTASTTVTVLDHADPTLVVSGGDNQSVIVGATDITATLNLANGTAGDADRSPMSVQNLSAGLTGTTGTGVIASGASRDYTASLDTSSIGAAQEQVFTLDAGDQQNLPGAAPLTTQTGIVTVNVYGHAAPVLSGTTFDLGYIHVGYGSAVTATQTVTNGETGDYIVDLKADGATSGVVSVNGIGGISAGDSAAITATFATGQGVGVINENIAYTFADDSTLAGASANVGSYTLNVQGLVYSGHGVWTSMTGGSWGTYANSFGVNWQAYGGSPGLDAAFTDTDTVTFGASGAGVVTLDGAAPSLRGLTFDNATASYLLRQGTGGVITLNGGSGSAMIENLAGSHAIAAPVSLATDTTLSVVGDLLSFTGNSVISGSGRLIKQGAGTVRIAGTNTFSGGMQIEAGRVETVNVSALGTGPVTLNAGTLVPTGTLNISSFTWSGGQLSMTLGNASSLVNVSDQIENGGAGGTFIFTEGAGFLGNVDYTLLSFGSLDGFVLADFVGNHLYGITPTFSLVGNELLVRFIGPSSGRILSNYAPVFTPITADFRVDGKVQTSNAPNRVNSLTFIDKSELNVFNQLTITSGRFSVNHGSAVIRGSGSMITPDSFTKLGEGSLNVLSNLFVNGDLLLQNGTLAINGNATMQNLLVRSGAILKGDGFVDGNVSNSGTIAPGNSPGLLTVSGNFTQSRSGRLEVEIASLSNFDQLVVGGHAKLDGKLQVSSFAGHEFEYGQQFAFLHAGSISGAFADIETSDPRNFRARFLKSAGTGSILIAPSSYTLVAKTDNQRSIASALDRYIPAQGNDREAVSIALDHLTAEQYPAAFDQIMPGFYESLADTTIEQAVMQSQLLSQRLSAVRLGARGFSAVGIQSPMVIDKDGKSIMSAKEGHGLLVPSDDHKWGVWVQGNGAFAKITRASQIPNYHTEAGGLLMGTDYRWNENLATGLYVGYQGLHARYANGSKMKVDSTIFGGYATYDNGGFYVDAMIGGGHNSYNVRRSIKFSDIDRTARSNPSGGLFATYLDAGYDWTADGFSFGPIASAQYTYSSVSPFTESGADSLDLRLARQNVSSIRTNLGGRVAYTWSPSEKVVLIPEVRVFWQHEFLQDPTNILANLDGGAGPSFSYKTSAPSRDSVFIGVGATARLGKNLDGYLFYNADFARHDYLSHAISAGLNWKF